VGVVVFSDRAWILADLTGDRAPVVAALEDLPHSEGTRIGAGLRLAHEMLAQAGRDGSPGDGDPPRQRALLLLTDGIPSRSGEADVLAAARAVRSAGIQLFAVGLGADVRADLLTEVAGEPARYHPAPEAEDLERIYRHLARVIPCPLERRDWGPPGP
jgi:Mg-chelatase subunit ChlD